MKSFSGGGIVNAAFSDDDDVERRMSYAKWINHNQGASSIDYVELSFQRDSVINELDQVLEHKNKKKGSKTSTAKKHNDENFFKPPSGTISRSAMLRKISRKSRRGTLGEVCKDMNCPYNQWLYRKEDFPTSDQLESWERQNKPELTLNPKQLPEVPRRVSSRARSPESGFRSPSFSYFRYPESPLASTPPWNMYSSSQSLSSYPIITLPRSIRKSEKRRSSVLGNLFNSRPDISTNISTIQPRNSRPGSRVSFSESESGSSTCSTCSSCSCSCSSSSLDTEDPVTSLSKNPFLIPPASRPGKLRRMMPPCDLTCYIITVFTVLCLAGVFAAFLYVYINNATPEMLELGENDSSV